MKTTIRGSFVDVSNIGREIDKYVYEYGDNPKYIVMSSSTLSLLEASIDNLLTKPIKQSNQLNGVNIAICDRMPIGVYEIV